MADSDLCIVCLGELRASDNDVAASPIARTSVADEETIAHLLPCAHNLHNECLKPWVERANSCPICRRNFNEVELRTSINGKLLPLAICSAILIVPFRHNYILLCRT